MNKIEEIREAIKNNISLYHANCKTPVDLAFENIYCPDCHKFLDIEEVTKWK